MAVIAAPSALAGLMRKSISDLFLRLGKQLLQILQFVRFRAYRKGISMCLNGGPAKRTTARRQRILVVVLVQELKPPALEKTGPCLRAFQRRKPVRAIGDSPVGRNHSEMNRLRYV